MARFTLADLPPSLQAQALAQLEPKEPVLRPLSPAGGVVGGGEAPKALKSKGKAPRKARVERTRNANTLTEAGYWSMVRSCLRRAFRFWKPALNALKAARVPMKGPRGRKWGYVCAGCGKVFLRKEVEIHHVEAVGTLTDYAHVGDFLRRLTPESPDAYKILCLSCHQTETNTQRRDAA